MSQVNWIVPSEDGACVGIPTHQYQPRIYKIIDHILRTTREFVTSNYTLHTYFACRLKQQISLALIRRRSQRISGILDDIQAKKSTTQLMQSENSVLIS